MHKRFQRVLVVIGVLGVIGFALPAFVSATTHAVSATSAAAPASDQHKPQNVTCHSGDILTGFFGNVTVAKDNYCFLLQAIVEGNVTANDAVQLGIDHSTITGNIVATEVSDNGWICGSAIGGNVTITKTESNPETANSPGQWVIGDSGSFGGTSYCGNTQFDQVPGNFIVGDLNFNNNKSGATISNNDIEDDLNCTGNAPPPTGTNNQVDGPNTGQCSTTGGGTDNDTTSPGDND
jgi:hypothetical protein